MMSHLIKILSSKSSFAGVGYNMSKVQKGDAHLVSWANFGALSPLEMPRASDFIHYLQIIAKGNPRVLNPQLHAVLCVQGKSSAKESLPHIAERWLWGMGYREQPYLIFSHNDTPNDHLHILSVRVKKDGSWINPGLEWLNSRKVLDNVLGINVPQIAQKAAEDALHYNFNSPQAFMRILESKGFFMLRRDEQLLMCYYGKAQHRIPFALVQQRAAQPGPGKYRLAQLREVFLEQKKSFDPALISKNQLLAGRRASKFAGYTSPMKLGVEIIFHHAKGRLPHDYTIIDRQHQAVYCGAELMPIREFTQSQEYQSKNNAQSEITQYTLER